MNPNAQQPSPALSAVDFQQELTLLQDRIGRYDDLIWRYRGLAVTMTFAIIGWAIARQETGRADLVLDLAVIAPAFVWFQESVLRVVHWHKFVCRYRLIRDTLVGRGAWAVPVEEIARFDLDNAHGPKPSVLQIAWTCVFKIEMLSFYGFLLALAVGFRYALT